MQIGVDRFAALAHDGRGSDIGAADADRVRLDAIGIGEHHRDGFLDSAPTVILAAAASRTSRIRLASAVTVLSAADPVRVFQQFATLDLLSNGISYIQF